MEKSQISTNRQPRKAKSKKQKNVVIRPGFVRYNAKNLYDDNTTFRLPDYLINVINEDKKSLIFCHNNKTVCVYTHTEFLHSIETVSNKPYEGIYKKEKIIYNLAVIKLKTK